MWQEVWSEDWYAQERHDMPEEYGTTSLLVNMVNGERVWRDIVTRSHDWWDDGTWLRAGTWVYYHGDANVRQVQ